MLLFDLMGTQGYGTTKQSGGGKYAIIVFEALCQNKAEMICMWDSRRWIDDNLKMTCKKHHIELIDYANTSIDTIVRKFKVNCIYSALPNEELLSYKNCKVIVTLHGLRAIEIPYDTMLLRYPIPLSNKIKMMVRRILPKRFTIQGSIDYYGKYFDNEKLSYVTVSNHTKFAIATYFPNVKSDRIQVFYSPSTSYPIDAIKKKQMFPYFMIVSANREEKNALRAIIALDRLFESHQLNGFRVKLTGVESNIFRYKLKHPEYFDFYGYVSEEDLNTLYANAYALVYPSFTEGFGYPPLEAMRYGVPVLASPFTSIPEVCGDAALYFNPFSVEEIMNRILQIIDNEIYREIACKAFERYENVTSRQTDDLNKLVQFITSN